MSAVGSRSYLLTNVGTTGVVTPPFDVSNYDESSFAFVNDGGGNISCTMQMTNQVIQGDGFIPGQTRDDGINSADWTSAVVPSTSQSNLSGIAAGTSQAALVSCQAMRAIRFKVTSASTTTRVRVYALGSGASS